MDFIRQDLRQAFRSLRKRPLFALVVVITLALGIGVNSAIFTVVDATLLQPLPYPEPERLVQVTETIRRETTELRGFSYPDFVDAREQSTSFTHLAAYDGIRATVTGTGAPERLPGERVSSDYFAALGMEAVVGRPLLHDVSAETEGESGVREVVLGHGLWQRRFGGKASVLGVTLRLDGEAYTIVGVMPRGFAGLSDRADFWTSLSNLSQRARERRRSRFLEAVGRLRPEVGLEQAREELETLGARLEEAYPDTNRGYSATAFSLQDQMLGDLRRPLLLLAAAVGFVLLIACTNVANLLLARAAVRSRESAVRAALGAGRFRLLGHFLIEVVVLSLLGGIAGLLLAAWGLDLLGVLIPIELPSFVHLEIDRRVLGFNLALSLAVGVLLGLTPTWRSLLPASFETLRSGNARGATTGTPQRRFRAALVVTEVALALLLLIGAGLMLESFERLQRVEAGFDAEDLLFFRYDLSDRDLEEAEVNAIGRELRQRLDGIAGVEALALASDTPLEGVARATVVTEEHMQPDPAMPWNGAVRVYGHQVSDGFFSTLGIPLLLGRDFGPEDEVEEPSTVIVSAKLARRLWPDADPVGRRIRFGPAGDAPEEVRWMTVVGVAADVRYRNLVADPVVAPEDPDLYLPLNDYGNLSVAVRSGLPASRLFEAIRRTVGSFDPRLAVYSLETIADRLGSQTARSRFSSLLMGLFATVALALAGVGVYGVMSYSVGHRTREIGIRMALGAKRQRVLASVVGDGMLLVLFGTVLGVTGAFALTRYLSTLLHEVSATDPGVFLTMTVALALIALVACYLPARRASRVEPVIALRHE